MVKKVFQNTPEKIDKFVDEKLGKKIEKNIPESAFDENELKKDENWSNFIQYVIRYNRTKIINNKMNSDKNYIDIEESNEFLGKNYETQWEQIGNYEEEPEIISSEIEEMEKTDRGEFLFGWNVPLFLALFFILGEHFVWIEFYRFFIVFNDFIKQLESTLNKNVSNGEISSFVLPNSKLDDLYAIFMEDSANSEENNNLDEI